MKQHSQPQETHTFTVISAVDASPIPECTIVISLDEHGNDIIDIMETDEKGNAPLPPIPAMYYVWAFKPGWLFHNPTTIDITVGTPHPPLSQSEEEEPAST